VKFLQSFSNMLDGLFLLLPNQQHQSTESKIHNSKYYELYHNWRTQTSTSSSDHSLDII